MLAIRSQREKCHTSHCKFITKVCLTKRFFPRKLTWNLRKSPLGKGEENKTSSKPSLFGEFYLNFPDGKFKVDVKGLLTQPNRNTETSAAKRQWHVHQRRQVQNQRSRRKRMPTRSIECSQKMWRCVGVAMHFDDFVSEIRLLIFLGGRKHQIIGSIYFDIPTVNLEGKSFWPNGHFLPTR